MIGQTLKLSGIISICIIGILTCAIIMSHYSLYNMSDISKKSVGFTLSSLSHIAEGFLFFYLGISIFKSQVNFHSEIFLQEFHFPRNFDCHFFKNDKHRAHHFFDPFPTLGFLEEEIYRTEHLRIIKHRLWGRHSRGHCLFAHIIL